MKKILMILLVALTVSSVFAGGKNEETDQTYPYASELIQIEGPLGFGEYGEPFIEQDGTKYLLKIPFVSSEVPDVEEGDIVSVEGYTMQMNRFWNRDSYQHLMVTKAVVNGEEFEVEDFDGRFGYMDGPMGHGGRGHRTHGMMMPHGGHRW